MLVAVVDGKRHMDQFAGRRRFLLSLFKDRVDRHVALFIISLRRGRRESSQVGVDAERAGVEVLGGRALNAPARQTVTVFCDDFRRAGDGGIHVVPRPVQVGLAVCKRTVLVAVVDGKRHMDQLAGRRRFLGLRFGFFHLNVYRTGCIDIVLLIRGGQFIPLRHRHACFLKQFGECEPVTGFHLYPFLFPVVQVFAANIVADMEYKVDQIGFVCRKRLQRQAADRHKDRDQHGQ